MSTNASRTGPWFIVSVLFAGVLLGRIAATADEGAAAKKEMTVGLNVGEHVPITSMNVVVGERIDSNTCLAGRNRGRRAISIYAASIDEPGLSDLVKKVDGLIGTEENLAAYLLLVSGRPNDAPLRSKIRFWAEDLGLKRIEVAISNSNANSNSRYFKLSEKVAITVVYSEKRLVALRSEFESKQLDEKVLADLDETLKKLTKGSADAPR